MSTSEAVEILASRDGLCRPVPVGDLKGLLKESGQIVWVDLNQTGPEQISFLRREFGFHELALEDVSRRRQRPKIDEYPEFTYLVMYAAELAADDLCLHQIDVFIGSNYVVTLHDGPVEEIRETQRRWQRDPAIASKNVSELLYVLLDALVDQYFPVIDTLSDQIDDLEEAVLAGATRDSVNAVARYRRQIMRFRRILGPERDILNTLLRREHHLSQEQMLIYFQDVYDHILRVLDQVDMLRDLLGAILEAHLVAVSNDLNAVMRRLTAWTIILMSVALVSGIYGMNFLYMPELQLVFGYPLALALMLVVGLLLYREFRRRGWL